MRVALRSRELRADVAVMPLMIPLNMMQPRPFRPAGLLLHTLLCRRCESHATRCLSSGAPSPAAPDGAGAHRRFAIDRLARIAAGDGLPPLVIESFVSDAPDA